MSKSSSFTITMLLISAFFFGRCSTMIAPVGTLLPMQTKEGSNVR